mmetsp:Transcript_59826/g.96735  ORF Transcript_59826/g.96735 Transcript_59826/m.96735 type:complete len:470 (-) Transcript_59826:87-1496(-)
MSKRIHHGHQTDHTLSEQTSSKSLVAGLAPAVEPTCLIHPLGQHSLLIGLNLVLDLFRVHLGIFGEILRVLPLEILDAVLSAGLPSEMAVCCTLHVLRLPELQRLGNSTRTAVESQLDDVRNIIGSQVALLRTVSLDENRQRLGHTDGVGKLHQSTLCKSRGHNGLGHLAGDVRSRAVHLRWVLAREGTTTMRTPATIGVDDDFPSGKTSISLRTTDDELPRGVDVNVAGCLVEDADGGLAVLQRDILQCGLDHVLHDLLVHLLHRRCNGFSISTRVASNLGTLGPHTRLSVLGGDQQSVNHKRLHGTIGVLLVLDGDLSLTIRAQPPQLPTLADVSEGLAKLGCKVVGQRHGALGLIRCIPKHDTLVTCTNVHLITANVHTTGNIGRLCVDTNQHLAVIAVQALRIHARQVINERVEPDVTHGLANNGVVVQLCLRGDLSQNHHHVVLHSSLAGHLAQGIFLQAGIKN